MSPSSGGPPPGAGVLPEHGSRWWMTRGSPGVADVVHDARYKKRLRFYLLNDIRPFGSRDDVTNSTSVEEWNDLWQVAPRIDLKWLNTGSVWRRLPRVGWRYRDRNLRVDLQNLVVIDCVHNGGVSLAKVQLDGTLERYHAVPLGGLGLLTCHQFMLEYARVWSIEHQHGDPFLEDGDPNIALFPDVLYNLGYLQQRTVQVPTADETVQALADIAEAEASIANAKRVIAERKKAMKIKPPKQRKRKRKTVQPKTALERILEDHDDDE